ncbi:MAG: hypothetical protein Q4D94_13070 [Bacillota bacterium]|nr:hypothetical protein [Bacillota bacterium]
MAWCPKCKCEYIAGITVCADCGCELVDELVEETNVQGGMEAFLTEDVSEEMIMAAAQAMVENGDIPEELMNADELEGFAFDEEESAPSYQGVYMNNEERAEENRTSAYTLLAVGGLGLIVIILFFVGVIDINMSVTNKYIVTGVMGVLFILFIIMGIVSLRNSKILKRKAYKENNLTTEIKKWCVENLHEESIDAALELSEEPLELKYFQRIDYMKKAISKQFMNLDEAYLDRLIEEVYPEIFEDGEE